MRAIKISPRIENNRILKDANYSFLNTNEKEFDKITIKENTNLLARNHFKYADFSSDDSIANYFEQILI